MKRLLPILLVLFLASFISACSDDDGVDPLPVPEQVRGLYILNEGTFQRSNASLSIYLPDSNQVFNNVFSAAAGRPLGDVGNSMTVHDGKLWIVVNNSNRIEVMDLETREAVTSIECPEGASPRHIVFADDGTGYVSNLYRNSVSVLDAASGSFTAEIPVGSNPDGMVISAGRLFVANSGFGADNTVSVIDLATGAVVKTLTVGDYPATVLTLNSDAIAVLCTGAYNDFNDPNDDTPGKLYVIDTQLQTVVDSLTLGGHPTRLARDDQGYLYTLNGGVTRIHLASKSVTEDYISGFFYGLCVDTGDQRIYVTNPVDYVQNGSVEYYSYAGSKLGSIDVGVLPGSMVLHP